PFIVTVAIGTAQTIASIGLWIFAQRQFALILDLRFILKLSVACAFMAAAVILDTAMLSSWLGLLSGIALGIVVFVLMVRLTKLLAREDRDRLLHLDHYVPANFRKRYSAIVFFLAPLRLSES